MYHINNSTHVTSSAGAYFSGLVSLTMNNCYLSFGELDFLLSLTPSLIHFKLINVGWNSNSLFDGFRWEKFIQKRLPFLNNLHSIINSYRTPFWLERKHWYVTCDYTISASSSQTLTKLHIGGNHIELQGIQRLTNALEKNTTLTILDLQDNQIGDEGIEYFCNSLKNTLTLTSLDLSSNQIEAPGARYMADLLENNSILDTLSLRDNELRSRGIEYLAYALKTNITLTTLNLRFNYIDDDGIESLADTLRANK
ncbi:unnamed protein product, partial [Rotaria magnacalcarata]